MKLDNKTVMEMADGTLTSLNCVSPYSMEMKELKPSKHGRRFVIVFNKEELLEQKLAENLINPSFFEDLEADGTLQQVDEIILRLR